MVLLVTGGAGFIGSNFVQYWLQQYPDDTVVCYDLLTYAGSMDNVSAVADNKNFHFVRGDICSSGDIDSCFARYGVDMVINFAAESHVDNSVLRPQLFASTNIMGVQVLLDACVRHGVKLFYQISTDEVYGSGLLDGRQCTESDALRPSSPYSASKAAADLLALSYYSAMSLPVIISRSSNNYGRHQHAEKFIPKIITNALAGKAIPVYGNGSNVRNWLHVLDHCSAIDAIIHHGTVGQIYNIAGNCTLSNIALVDIILQRLGISDRSLVHFVADRVAHDICYNISSQKLYDTVGWQATMPFCDGINALVDSYINSAM